FDPKRPEGFYAADHANGFSRCPLHSPAWIDQQVALRAQRLTRRAYQLNIKFGVLAKHSPPKLHRSESLLDITFASLFHCFRRRTEERARVSADAVPAMGAKQFVYRLLHGLADDAPKTIVNS